MGQSGAQRQKIIDIKSFRSLFWVEAAYFQGLQNILFPILRQTGAEGIEQGLPLVRKGPFDRSPEVPLVIGAAGMRVFKVKAQDE